MSGTEIGAIVQARRGSSRLPNKVIKLIQGKPMLAHVISRVKRAKLVDSVFLATTDRPEDRMLAKIADEEGIGIFYGSQDDVLDRYYKCATRFGIKNIVRITADCPLIDPGIIDMTVTKFLEEKYDYVGNAIVPTFPDGLDVEVFSFQALEKAWKNAALVSEREHVTPYIWKNPGLFKLGEYSSGTNLSHMRWTVDNKEDMVFVRRVYRHLYPSKKFFSYIDVLALLERQPGLAAINIKISRNEGYKKSIENDRKIR